MQWQNLKQILNWKKSAITSRHSFSTRASNKHIDSPDVQGEKAEVSKLNAQFSGHRSWLCTRIAREIFLKYRFLRPQCKAAQTDITSLWPWQSRFSPSLPEPSPAASFASLIPGEHAETTTSAHQLIIKLGLFQFRTIPTSQSSQGKAF